MAWRGLACKLVCQALNSLAGHALIHDCGAYGSSLARAAQPLTIAPLSHRDSRKRSHAPC